MTKAIVFLFLALLAGSANGQSNKTILGTFSIGCRIFNYEFKSGANGLYSFRLDDIDKEGATISFDMDQVKELNVNLTLVLSKLTDTSNHENLTKNSDTLRDFLELNSYYLDHILSDSANLNFWYSNRNSILSLIGEAKHVNFLSYRPMLDKDSLFSFYVKRLTEIMPIVSKLIDTKTYTLNEFFQESFTTLITNLLTQEKIVFSKDCSYDTVISKKATAIFFDIKAKFDFKDDEPVTAYLKLKGLRVNCYYTKSTKLAKTNDDRLIENKLLVDDVSVEFEDGDIKNLFVDLRADLNDSIKGSLTLPVRFKNSYPITVSGKNDPEKFGYIKIFVDNPHDINEQVRLDPTAKNTFVLAPNIDSSKEREGTYYVILSELLDYSIVAQSNNEDYSPANAVVHLNKNNPTQELKKEKRSKILNARTFTDLQGIQGDQPNGLIQVEVSKKINILTNRHGNQSFYWGSLTYIEPDLSLSKIEKNKNSLELSFQDLDSVALTSQGRKRFRVNAIDLLRYQNSVFDINANLYKFNFPALKSNLQLNGSAGILRTNVSDSIGLSGSTAYKTPTENTKTLNTIRWGISLIFEIKPDSRYGISFGWDARFLSLESNDYFLNDTRTNAIYSFWTDAYLKTNDDNDIFFRYKYSYGKKLLDQNFLQVQLGYQLDLFKSTK
jgi:hypothetical protein